MAILGTLFDIDDLGGGFYGAAAYKIFFDTVGRANLRDVALYDGDTNATLRGEIRDYCIAVEGSDEGLIRRVEQALAASSATGLVPPSRRFLRGQSVKAEPLVPAGGIDSQGTLLGCDTPWIISAWRNR